MIVLLNVLHFTNLYNIVIEYSSVFIYAYAYASCIFVY